MYVPERRALEGRRLAVERVHRVHQRWGAGGVDSHFIGTRGLLTPRRPRAYHCLPALRWHVNVSGGELSSARGPRCARPGADVRVASATAESGGRP